MKKPFKKPIFPVTFPAILDTPEFRQAWEDYLAARIERFPREKLTVRMLLSQVNRCASAPGGHDHAVAMLKEAADRGWKAVFHDWVPNPRNAKAVAAATAAYTTPEKPAPREAWQIEKDLVRLRAERSSLWRSDFETTDGRTRYAAQWEKCLALAARIKALESELSAAR